MNEIQPKRNHNKSWLLLVFCKVWAPHATVCWSLPTLLYTPIGRCRQQSCQCKPTICRELHFQPQVKSTSWIRTAMECCPAFAISSQLTVSTKHRSGFFSMRTLPRKMFVNAYSPNSCNITRSETHHIHIRFCLDSFHVCTKQNRIFVFPQRMFVVGCWMADQLVHFAGSG
jgi:hypothetical protein